MAYHYIICNTVYVRKMFLGNRLFYVQKLFPGRPLVHTNANTRHASHSVDRTLTNRDTTHYKLFSCSTEGTVQCSASLPSAPRFLGNRCFSNRETEHQLLRLVKLICGTQNNKRWLHENVSPLRSTVFSVGKEYPPSGSLHSLHYPWLSVCCAHCPAGVSGSVQPAGF